jgi:Tfp pilus assembly protein PilV
MAAKIGDQTGLTLVDVLVALAVLGVTGFGFIASLGTGSLVVRDVRDDVVAQQLVRSQLEFTKTQEFDEDAMSYALVAAPQGYTVTADVSTIPGADQNIQRITVTVSRGGETILTTEEYKQNR